MILTGDISEGVGVRQEVGLNEGDGQEADSVLWGHISCHNFYQYLSLNHWIKELSRLSQFYFQAKPLNKN